jgi:PQQ-like domain
VRALWSQKTTAALRGLSLARERGWVLAWDAQHWLYLFNRNGEKQAQLQAPGPLAAAVAADDGHTFAAAGQGGEVWLLAPDLMPRWTKSVGQRAVSIAIAPLGQFVAVADAGGNVHLFDRKGSEIWQVSTARPLQHLVFVPEKPVLVGSADFGLVTCLSETGAQVWRDGLVAHSGSLATSGDGSLIVLACFTDGLWCYDLAGKKSQLARLAPCRLADLSYDGSLILSAGLENRLQLHRRDGSVKASAPLDGVPAALALGPLGEVAVVGLAEGKVVQLATASK